MPLEPIYQPNFTSEQISDAEKIARSHKSGQTKAKRAKLLLLLAETPNLSSPACASALGIHEQTVRKWRKRWSEEEVNLEDKPRPGRPPGFSPSAERSCQSNRLRVASGP